MPLSIKTWRAAITAVYCDERAKVVAEYDDWVVHSAHIAFKVPAVIMLKNYITPELRVKFSRYNVYLRDEFTCQYCGNKFDKDELTLDHVKPRYHGGKTNWSNCVACCHDCNADKAHFLDKLPMQKPRQPDYFEIVKKRRKQNVVVFHPSWIDYLGWDEDLIIPHYDKARRWSENAEKDAERIIRSNEKRKDKRKKKK